MSISILLWHAYNILTKRCLLSAQTVNSCKSVLRSSVLPCTEYECDFPCQAQEVPLSGIGSTYHRFYNAKKCWPKPALAQPLQKSSPQPGVEPQPVATDGVPVDYEMESFIQIYEQCETDEDVWNKTIKERQLWNDRGPVELSQIPEYKPCGVKQVQLTRSGKPISRDGMPNGAANLQNTSAETDLFGLSRYLVAGDTAIQQGARQVCAIRPLDTRAIPTVELTEIYRQTQFDPAKFSKQLCNDLGENPRETCAGGAYRFNNQSRQRTRVQR